jgi:hypothetical protein
MDPRATLTAFDAFLAERSHRCTLTIVGGSALAMLGVIRRATRDCDVLEPILDATLLDLAQAFARQQTTRGTPLAQDWLNNGPASLVTVLPSGWRDRLVVVYQGAALSLWALGRTDLLGTKLWALCDRGTDLADCVAIAPTADELAALTPWLHDQDANPDWPTHVNATLADVARRCHHGV